MKLMNKSDSIMQSRGLIKMVKIPDSSPDP